LVEDMLEALKGRTLVGAYSMGAGGVEACTAILKRHPGKTNRFIAVASFGSVGAERLKSSFGRAIQASSMLKNILGSAASSVLTRVPAKFIQMKDLCNPEGPMAKLYTEYLPSALAQRQYIPAADPLVVGKGLDELQNAFEIQKKGVSAKKVVVSL
jgi:hypothetical protein